MSGRAFSLGDDDSSSESEGEETAPPLAPPPAHVDRENDDVKNAEVSAADAAAAARRRFRVELEFVQCLASPLYLHFLAQNEYLDSPEFLEYLRYLRYWQTPEYARHIEYPMCLGLLGLLVESERFRSELKHAPVRDWVHQQQYEHWRAEGRSAREPAANNSVENSVDFS